MPASGSAPYLNQRAILLARTAEQSISTAIFAAASVWKAVKENSVSPFFPFLTVNHFNEHKHTHTMQYGQIALLIAIGFLVYYAVMIVMDLQKTQAAKLAEAKKDSEEDIDISDEARRFQPVLVRREEKAAQTEKPKEESPASSEETEAPSGNPEDAGENTDQQQEPPRRPDYREPIMTDGITVDNLVEEVNTIAETGKSDLGAVIYYCEKAKSA